MKSSTSIPNTTLRAPLLHPGARRTIAQLSDRELTARYWAARCELDALRRSRAEVIAREGPGEAPPRIVELEGLCERIWNECRRSAVASELLAA